MSHSELLQPQSPSDRTCSAATIVRDMRLSVETILSLLAQGAWLGRRSWTDYSEAREGRSSRARAIAYAHCGSIVGMIRSQQFRLKTP